MKKVHRMDKPILYESVKKLLDLHRDRDDELLLIHNTLLLFLNPKLLFFWPPYDYFVVICPHSRRPSATPWNPDLPFILAVFLTPRTLCQSFEAFLCIFRTGTRVHLKNRDIYKKTEELKELKKITQRWVYYQPTHSDDDSDFFFFLATSFSIWA